MSRRVGNPIRAFTLLEVVVALAITGWLIAILGRATDIQARLMSRQIALLDRLSAEEEAASTLEAVLAGYRPDFTGALTRGMMGGPSSLVASSVGPLGVDMASPKLVTFRLNPQGEFSDLTLHVVERSEATTIARRIDRFGTANFGYLAYESGRHEWRATFAGDPRLLSGVGFSMSGEAQGQTIRHLFRIGGAAPPRCLIGFAGGPCADVR